WFRGTPSAPTVVRNLIDERLASALANELFTTSEWEYQYWILDTKEQTHQVSRRAYLATPKERRFSASNTLSVARVFSRRRLTAANAFLEVLSDGKIAAWLSEVTGHELRKAPSCEFTRYQIGDHLKAHTDTFDGRRIGMLLYLNPGWKPRYGGQLGYRN